MDSDPLVCFKRNNHGRTLEEIEAIASRFAVTPTTHISLDVTSLLQSAAITLVDMEDVDSDDDVIMEDVQHEEVSAPTRNRDRTPQIVYFQLACSYLIYCVH